MGQISLSELNTSLLLSGRRHRFDHLQIGGVLLVSLFVLSPQICFAQTKDTLNAIEQKLFFKSYSDEGDDSRLARLEKQLFGETMVGPFQSRLSRVVGAASPQTNPDGSISGMSSGQSSGTTSSSSAPSAEDLKARAEDERQAAMDRAKVAVAAAREEQTNKIIETGVTLWRAKRGTEALQYFEQALKMDPHNASALYYAGIVYESKKSYSEALAAYRKASNEDPGNREYSEAVMAVQKLMNSRPAVDPKQAEISKLASEAGDAYKRGEFLSALDLYKQLDQKAPNQPLVKYNLGTLYLHAGQYQTALEYFEMAVKLRPTDQKFQQAYQQLKANVDKSNAAEAAAESNFNGNNGAARNGMGQSKSYGHEAMNIAAQGGSPSNNMQGGAGQMSANGMQSNMQQRVQPSQSPQSGGGAQTLGSALSQEEQQQGAPRNVAIPPGAGHEPGFAPMTDGNGTLQNWATQAQNKGKPGAKSAAAKQPAKTQQSAQSQQPTQVSFAPASSQGAPSDSQNSFQSSPQFQSPPQGSSQSQIPAGQHPLVYHPLKGAKPVASSSDNNSSYAVPGESMSQLRQPPPNPLTDLGILAVNGKNGVTISHVGIASRASRAGLLQGDIIRAVDSKVISSLAQMTQIISQKKMGETVTLHVQRKDQMGVVHL
jgi:tetratricopeptide (TPR) repeat protein